MPSPASDKLRRPFTLAGRSPRGIRSPVEMTILGQTLRLAPLVSAAGLELGRPIVVAGYREFDTEAMVVTRLRVT